MDTYTRRQPEDAVSVMFAHLLRSYPSDFLIFLHFRGFSYLYFYYQSLERGHFCSPC